MSDPKRADQGGPWVELGMIALGIVLICLGRKLA